MPVSALRLLISLIMNPVAVLGLFVLNMASMVKPSTCSVPGLGKKPGCNTADGRIPNNADETTYMPNPMMWMMQCAARTETIKLGTAVMIFPVRNPEILAKHAASFDNLPNGRGVLGFGVGWLKEAFELMKNDFHAGGKRVNEYNK